MEAMFNFFCNLCARAALRQQERARKLCSATLNKLLKTQAGDISPYFYEKSLRLCVYDIRANFSCHFRGTSKNS